MADPGISEPGWGKRSRRGRNLGVMELFSCPMIGGGGGGGGGVGPPKGVPGLLLGY